MEEEFIQDSPSGETLKRLKLAYEYGSYENYRDKMALRLAYKDTDASYKDLVTAKKKGVIKPRIDDITEELDFKVSYWMDPIALRSLPLALIGSPEGSEEWNRDNENQPNPSARVISPSRVFYYDYAEMGWPASAGKPVRRVTPQEHRELLRRLRATGLTKPGAEVPTVGKTLAQIIEEDRPQPGWIIKDVLRWGGAAMVYGPSGIGKTWLVHTLMLMAAAGNGVGVYNEQVGRWTFQAGGHKGAKVCLIDGEMITPDIGARAQTLCGALGLRMVGTIGGAEPIDTDQLRLALEASGEDPSVAAEIVHQVDERDSRRALRLPQALGTVGEYMEGLREGGSSALVDLSRIVVFPKAEQDHRATFVDLADPEWKHRVIQYCRKEEVKVLILDNLATLSESLEDENSAANWNPLNSLIVALKKEGVATIIVHHTNKTGQSYRGSTSIETTLETSIGLERVEGENDGAAFRVVFKKNRAHGKPESDGKILKLKEGRWVSEVDPADLATEVVIMARTLKYKNQTEIGLKLGVDQATVSRAITTAVAKGLVEDGEVNTLLRQARELAKQLEKPVDPEVIDDGPEVELDL